MNDGIKFISAIMLAGAFTAAAVHKNESEKSTMEANKVYAAKHMTQDEFQKATKECSSWIDKKEAENWAKKVETLKLKAKMDSIYWEGYKRAVDSINANKKLLNACKNLK